MAINPKIKQKAEDIRSKIFGSEVRESLASGIEAISEDVEATIGRQDYVEEQFQNVIDETTDKDVISAPELIAARNGKSNLKTRLDDEHAQVTAQLQQTEQELISQLAQRPTQTEVDTKVSQIVSGSPKGTYATLSALQTAKPTGDTGIYVVTADGKWYYWNATEWKEGGTYQATEIADKGVTPDKTSFIQISNLLDISMIQTGGYYRYNTGVWKDDEIYDSTDFLEVIHGETYYFKANDIPSTHCVFWNENKQYITGENLIANNNIVTINIPNNKKIKYMTLMMRTEQTNSAILSIGDINGNYITDKKFLFSSIVFDKPFTVAPDDTTFLTEVENLFNPSDIIPDGYYNNGVWKGYTETENNSTGFIEVEKEHVYDISSNSLNIGHINYWDKNRLFISSIPSLNLTGNTYTLTIPSDDDIKYMTFLFTTPQLNTLKVEPRSKWYRLNKPLDINDVRLLNDKFEELSREIQSITDTTGLHWHGKEWRAFGTSITSTEQGKYVPYLSDLSGMNVINYGIPGGSIGFIDGKLSSNILTAIKTTDLSTADLVTIEGFVNDFAGSLPIGNVGDTTNTTLAGALYQAITHIYQNSNATVVCFTEHTGQRYDETSGNYVVDRVNTLDLTQQDYNKMIVAVCEYLGCPVIKAGEKSMINQWHPEYLVDHIHHSDLGGKQYANTIWDELKNIHCKIID